MIAGGTRLPCAEGVIRAGAANAPCAPRAGPWVLAATILGSSMVFIDGTAVNVALPALQANLGATAAGVQWVAQAYALTLAALLLAGGALGDRYGRRRIYVAGIALFTLASVACGLASAIGQLVAARAVQGVGGALLTPGSLAIISASFAGERRGRAIGMWSGSTAITSALGPVLGGWLVAHLSWRWIFFLNVPLAALTLALVLRHVPESRDAAAPRRLDWRGAALATAGLAGVVYGLTAAGGGGLGDAPALAALAVGLAGLAAFFAWEARSPAPMLPLGLFRSRDFSGANLLTLLLYAALGGTLYFFPFDLIQVQGYSATAAGLALVPFILIMFASSRWSGGLVARFGAKLPLTVGPLIAAGGFALFARPSLGGSYWTTFFPAVVTLGIGMAISVAPLTTTVMGAVEGRHAGIASGINNAVSRVAALLAVAALGIVMLGVFSGGLAGRLDRIGLPPGARAQVEAQRDRLAGADPPGDIDAGQRAALRRAIDESFVAGFRAVMLAGAGLALGSAVIAWTLLSGKAAAGEEAGRAPGGAAARGGRAIDLLPTSPSPGPPPPAAPTGGARRVGG